MFRTKKEGRLHKNRLTRLNVVLSERFSAEIKGGNPTCDNPQDKLFVEDLTYTTT